MPRSWRGSIGSAARPRSWRRSGRRSDASSPILCWLRLCASRRRSCERRLTVSFGLVCCAGRVARRTRPTFSSMYWYGMRLTARCCASLDGRFMPESPKPSKVSSRRSPRTSPSCWRVTAARRGRSRKPRRCGAKPDCGRRSALVEAAEQLKRALDQIATLSATPALRREEIKLQVALITPLLHVNGYAAPETRAAVERARLLIEQAEALGEPPEDPLLLFSVLYGFWVANLVAFKGDVMRELAAQFLALADKQKTTGPLMMGHRLMGLSLLHTGDIVDGQAHLDRAITFHDPAEHRPLATRFGQDIGAATLSWKSLGFWLLGYPEAALADSEHAVKVAREIGHSATLMYVLNFSAWTHILCGNYAAANVLVDEFDALKDQTGSLFWGAWGMMQRGCLLALTGKASDAVETITSGVTAMQSTGTTMWMPLWLSYLTRANAEIGQFDNASSCITEATAAVEAAKESWCEAEVNRIGGEIALLSPEPDLAKAKAYFAHALAVARQQQAKSWELRAAMSMARLWRDQGKCNEACKLLAPVYDWFSEGFDTRDLKGARDLLGLLTSSGRS